MKVVSNAVIALAGAAMMSSSALAAGLVYNDVDTRANGHSQAVASPSEDADGSLRLTTTSSDSTGKVDVLFSKPDFSPLGTLGDLNQLAADFFKSNASTVSPDAALAFRLNLGLSGGQPLALVWENQYNGSGTVPTNTWTTANILGGNFWQRGNGANFNGGTQAVSISSWLAGHSETHDGDGAPALSAPITASTPVYGLEAAYGSSTPGLIDENIDNVQLGFGGATPASFTGNVVAPEPASIGLLGIGASLLVRRRRTIA
jgi:hypothetical protein